MAKYKEKKCEDCKQDSRAVNSVSQNIIQGMLFTLFIIPGVIYWFVSTGKSCYICGLKYKNNNKKEA